MATQRDISKRIQSVTNIRKITRTMEMISASKMKKVQDRLAKAKPFEEKTSQILGSLLDYGIGREHRFFTHCDTGKKSLIIMITGNRGLCGGFNTSVIDNTISFNDSLISNGYRSSFYVIGQKGINFFKSDKDNYSVLDNLSNLEDKISLEFASGLVRKITALYDNKEVDEVYISYTKIFSTSSYKPHIQKLFPLSIEDFIHINSTQRTKYSEYIFEPDPASLFRYLLPLYVNMLVYRIFLESGFSEQNARRIAMKNATDAATDMVKDLTVKYNRTRQAKITNEIAEIVGGASALE